MNSRTDLTLDGLKLVMAGLFGWLITVHTKALVVLPIIGLLVIFLFQMRLVPNRRLRNIHERLTSFIELAGFTGRVRMTIHRPIWRNRYQQVISYVPSNEGKRRKFPNSLGIVGKCIAEPSHVHIENFQDDEAYSELMVDRYGYTVEESKKRTTDRRSYYAHPLLNGDELVAILYLDSTEYREFPAARQVEVDGLLDDLSSQVSGLLGHRGRIRRRAGHLP